MTPLRNRIPAVLALQPMTVAQIARCVSANEQTIRRSIADLESIGKVDLVGFARNHRKARYANVYGVAA